MIILSVGDLKFRKHYSGEFLFKCKRCGCVWEADRGDKGLHISSPFLPFFATMECPYCGKKTDDRDW